MAALSPNFLRKLEKMVRDEADSLELSESVVVTDDARNLIVDVVVESTIYRAGDWKSQHFIDVSDATRLMQVVDVTKQPVNSLLLNAKPVNVNGTEYVCMISLLQSIHDKWCGVWPFCR